MQDHLTQKGRARTMLAGAAFLSCALGSLLIFPLPGAAQNVEQFDPVPGLDRIAGLSERIAEPDPDRDYLDASRQEIEQLRDRAEQCVEEETPNVENLAEQFALYEGLTAEDAITAVWDQRNEVNRRLDAARARQGACTQLATEAATLLEVVSELQTALSARFLWQRTDNVFRIMQRLPVEIRDWPEGVRDSVELRLSGDLSPGTLLAFLVFAGLAAVVVGLLIRQRFRRWYAAGNRPGAPPRLKYLAPKPLAHYAPLLLQGIALTLTLVVFATNASLDLPVIRVALALSLYALGCVVLDWTTGPLSPSANVEGLIPGHVVPLRRRVRLLILALVANFIVSGGDWLNQRPGTNDPLVELLLLGATAITLLFVVLYLRHIPGLQGRFRMIRLAATLAIIVGIVALIIGYQNFASYVIFGVVQSAIALIALWILFWLTVTSFEAMVEGDTLLARQIGELMGVSKDKPNTILGFMQLSIDLVLWIAVVLFLIGVWDTSGNTVEELFDRVMRGGTIGQVELVPVQILAGIIGFASLIVLTGWARRWVDRRWLRHLALDRGARDALVTLLGYVGFIVALLFALNLAGIDLSGLAIVAGALAVGIGFGLQAITSNFVSGLILLLERPIKAGDFVTVGDVEGFIRQIRIRATEIETLDDQNVLVPNSELVSGRVTNWVLRDPQGRLRVQVGVAYGSDVELVREILVKVAHEHPDVITDGSAPAPRALFMSFGDSSLDFELRVRVKRIERRFTVLSDLNFAIDAAFREAGVTIPFPQRDLHLISTPDRPAVAAPKETPARAPEKPAERRSKPDQRTRSQTHETQLHAPLEVVWRALTENETAERWLAAKADLNAKVGGRFELVLSNDRIVKGHIDRFMPPRRLRMVLEPPEGDSPLPTGPITEEIELTDKDEHVTVTVTVAGIPATEDWEQFYRSSEDRWQGSLKDLARILGTSK